MDEDETKDSTRIPHFLVETKDGVTILTNRHPEQPSFLHSERETSSNEELETPVECKNCNCKNSKCLKLYCECFAASLYCTGCNCSNCMNTPDCDEIRLTAIQAIRSRNPDAFKAKSSKSRESTGCRCKRSGCTKKYCECFQNNRPCTNLCQCSACRNPFHSHSPPSRSSTHRFNFSAINKGVVELTRSMVLAVQRLSDQEAAQGLLTLSFRSPDGPRGHKRSWSDYDADNSLLNPPSPETARLLCDENPQQFSLSSERTDLYRRQEYEVLSRVDAYFKTLVSETFPRSTS